MEFNERLIKPKVCSSTHCITEYFQGVRNRHKFDVNVFGLELEWNHVIKHDLGHPRLDVVNICTSNNHCVIIGHQDRQQLPPILQTFLEAHDIVKVGVGITEQTDILREVYGVDVQSVVDVRHLVDEEGFDSSSITKLPWILGKHNLTYNSTEKSVWRMTSRMIFGRATKVSNFALLYNSLTLRRAREMAGYRDWEIHKYGLFSEISLTYWRKYFNQPFNYEDSRAAKAELVETMLELGDTRCRTLESEDEYLTPNIEY